MPYSEKQRTLARIALSMKRGKTPKSYSKAAAKMSDSMTEKQLEDYAKGDIKQ
jgi:hypothetical protein